MNDHYFSESPLADDRPREISVRLAGRDISVRTSSGVFSPGRLDIGTQVLLRALPLPPAGSLLDLGSGWGPIALHAALQAQDEGIEVKIWALDVNERALDLVRRNAEDLGLSSIAPVRAADVPPAQQFDAIWSNPPIRIGKQALHELLLTWLPRLRVGGEAWLVVSKSLGADSLLAWLSEQLGNGYAATKHSSSKGFRVLRISRLS